MNTQDTTTHSIDPPVLPPPKRSKKGYIITAAVALTVGLGLGAASATGSDSGQTGAASTTVQADPTTVTQVPPSCLAALNSAEAIGSDAADVSLAMAHFSHIVVAYPQLVYDAANAGLSQDAAALEAVATQVGDITTKVKANNATLNAITVRVGHHVDAYKAAAAQCRSAA